MRKPLLVLAALAAVTITASVADRAEASPPINPSALSGVVDDLGIFDNVHCRPGRPHHEPNRWRRANGCARNAGAVVVVPGRTRYIYRDGVRVRVGSGGGARTTVRSTERTTVRTRTNTNVRQGSGGMGGGAAATQRDGGNAGAGAGTQGGGGVQKGGGSQKGGSQN